MAPIVVNGKSYSSVEEMPPEIRKVYQATMGILADGDKNGIPDILEGSSGANINIRNISAQTGSATIIDSDGKMYTDVSNLPPEAQEKYRRAMEKLGQVFGDADRNGIPDFMETVRPADAEIRTAVIPSGPQDFPRPSPPLLPPVAEETSSRKWFLTAAILLLLLAGLLLMGLLFLIVFANNRFAG
jgi:hypothetical protein